MVDVLSHSRSGNVGWAMSSSSHWFLLPHDDVDVSSSRIVNTLRVGESSNQVLIGGEVETKDGTRMSEGRDEQRSLVSRMDVTHATLVLSCGTNTSEFPRVISPWSMSSRGKPSKAAVLISNLVK